MLFCAVIVYAVLEDITPVSTFFFRREPFGGVYLLVKPFSTAAVWHPAIAIPLIGIVARQTRLENDGEDRERFILFRNRSVMRPFCSRTHDGKRGRKRDRRLISRHGRVNANVRLRTRFEPPAPRFVRVQHRQKKPFDFFFFL